MSGETSNLGHVRNPLTNPLCGVTHGDTVSSSPHPTAAVVFVPQRLGRRQVDIIDALWIRHVALQQPVKANGEKYHMCQSKNFSLSVTLLRLLLVALQQPVRATLRYSQGANFL